MWNLEFTLPQSVPSIIRTLIYTKHENWQIWNFILVSHTLGHFLSLTPNEMVKTFFIIWPVPFGDYYATAFCVFTVTDRKSNTAVICQLSFLSYLSSRKHNAKKQEMIKGFNNIVAICKLSFLSCLMEGWNVFSAWERGFIMFTCVPKTYLFILKQICKIIILHVRRQIESRTIFTSTFLIEKKKKNKWY